VGYALGALRAINPTDSVALTLLELSPPKPSMPEDTKATIQQDYQRNVAGVQRFNIKAID
jgi:hypothetical protein